MRYDEIKSNHVWYGTTKVLAQDLLINGPDGIHFVDSPEKAAKQFERDFATDEDCIILEYKIKDDKPKFMRVYSGVIDDPLEETDTNELDEFALGGLQRCTAVSINALCKAFRLPGILLNDVPVDNPGVLRVLDSKGLSYAPDPQAVGRTLQQFVNMHKMNAWYLLTPGHALALINGELFDAENKGADGRKLQAGFRITRR